MSTLKFVSLAIIACLAACSSERATSSPAEEPSGVELELDDPEESTEGEMTETDSAEGEDTAAEPAASESEEPEAPPPPKQACADLKESSCKVTVGCVWSTDKKCMDE